MTIRVLHVLGALNRGGAETWLMSVLRTLPRSEVELDFLVHDERPGTYEAEAVALGARVWRCPRPRRPWSYAAGFHRVLAQGGPYDVVHSHVQLFSGFVLLLAARAGVPVRIAHSHVARPVELEARPGGGLGEGNGPLRLAYQRAMGRLLRTSATGWLACSASAARALFGERWQADPRARLVYCGIDLEPFTGPAADRAALGLGPDDVVFGHVGSFTPAKNHRFLLEIARALAAAEPRSRLLLVGDGPLRPEIEAGVRRLGLAQRVVFAGERSDVAAVLLALDAFLLPSLREGLPLALLEAQAAGLPCLVSEAVTREAAVVPALFTQLSLADPPRAWARAAREALRQPALPWREAALAQVRASPFEKTRSARALAALYGDLCLAALRTPLRRAS